VLGIGDETLKKEELDRCQLGERVGERGTLLQKWEANDMPGSGRAFYEKGSDTQERCIRGKGGARRWEG